MLKVSCSKNFQLSEHILTTFRGQITLAASRINKPDCCTGVSKSWPLSVGNHKTFKFRKTYGIIKNLSDRKQNNVELEIIIYIDG